MSSNLITGTNMKIYGPYTRNDGRKHIVIVHSCGRRQTKSYPKYLLEQKIGRELVGDETCDHIDEDFTNDSSDNLQVLSRPVNAAKSMLLNPAKFYHFSCPECHQDSVKTLSEVKANWKKGKAGPFCSRSCAGRYNKKKQTGDCSLIVQR